MKRSESPIVELPSEYFDDRPTGVVIDTIIIHSMYNPLNESLRFDAPCCKDLLDTQSVSAHYLVDRNGKCFRCVAEEKRAWHAGESKMPSDGRERVNEFSIGIELIGDETSGFTDDQYSALVDVTKAISRRYPIRNIFGHRDIAPHRKSDPLNFEWKRYLQALQPEIYTSPG